MSAGRSFEDLVAQAFSGDGDAFDALYGLVYRYLCFIGNHHDAEDIAQEALTAVWQRWKIDVHDRSRLKGWVLQIVHNRAVDNMRKQHANLSLDSADRYSDNSPLRDYFAVVCPEDIPEEYLERREFRELIWKALSMVSIVPRSCLVLRLMQGIRAKEVAELHHCSVRQIERYVRQGKTEFLVAYTRLLAERKQHGERRQDQ
jgi:RNA polymerase sigma factor (sigma-70 family)